MDTLASSNKNRSSSSSGCSTASSTTDIKTPKKCAREQKLLSSRSRSFLYCISKHLGRHFLHHHRHHDAVYNSQEDIRSSSTDSFSLSFERGSHAECQLASSSIDLTTEERSSRDSSASDGSRCSPPFCALETDEMDNYDHIYVDAMYRPMSALARNAEQELSSDECDEDEENQHPGRTCNLRTRHSAALGLPTSPASAATTPRSVSSASKVAGSGLHLSRISITSSVSRMLHHFSASASASTRSLSCSNTPLRRVKDAKKHSANVKVNGKKSVTSSTSAPSSTTAAAAAKKKEKKQQSILRPPVHYVYMKGMSGLYSRVPRYSVCCPYSMQQFA